MTRARGNVIAVLSALRGKRLTADDIACQIDSRPDTVRRLLRVLIDAGLVRTNGTATTSRRGTKPYLHECVNCAPQE